MFLLNLTYSGLNCKVGIMNWILTDFFFIPLTFLFLNAILIHRKGNGFLPYGNCLSGVLRFLFFFDNFVDFFFIALYHIIKKWVFD